MHKRRRYVMVFFCARERRPFIIEIRNALRFFFFFIYLFILLTCKILGTRLAHHLSAGGNNFTKYSLIIKNIISQILSTPVAAEQVIIK